MTTQSPCNYADTIDGQILTAQQLFDWATHRVTGIKFTFVTSESVLLHSKVLEVHFADTKSIPGTRSHQVLFKPLSRETLSLSSVSFDHKKSRIVPSFGATNMSDGLDEKTFTFGVYVVCVYDHDRKWFVGVILERCQEKTDVLVKFMQESHNLAWPSRPDICWIPLSRYLVSNDQVQSITRYFKKFFLRKSTRYLYWIPIRQMNPPNLFWEKNSTLSPHDFASYIWLRKTHDVLLTCYYCHAYHHKMVIA